MQGRDKFFVSSVKLNLLAAASDGELSDSVYRRCFFCEKSCLIQPATRQYAEKMTGPGTFYCPFCIRKGFYMKNSRNTLVLSFRSIIGHFYYQSFGTANCGKRMYLAEIEDYVHSHAETGLMNPVFDYDPHTFLWFVDFSRVGNSKKRLPLEEVVKTVVNVLSCFNLYDNIPGILTPALLSKYLDAIASFYQNRYRPSGKRMLIPTLMNCMPNADAGVQEKARFFTAREMCRKN